MHPKSNPFFSAALLPCSVRRDFRDIRDSTSFLPREDQNELLYELLHELLYESMDLFRNSQKVERCNPNP